MLPSKAPEPQPAPVKLLPADSFDKFKYHETAADTTSTEDARLRSLSSSEAHLKAALKPADVRVQAKSPVPFVKIQASPGRDSGWWLLSARNAADGSQRQTKARGRNGAAPCRTRLAAPASSTARAPPYRRQRRRHGRQRRPSVRRRLETINSSSSIAADNDVAGKSIKEKMAALQASSASPAGKDRSHEHSKSPTPQKLSANLVQLVDRAAFGITSMADPTAYLKAVKKEIRKHDHDHEHDHEHEHEHAGLTTAQSRIWVNGNAAAEARAVAIPLPKRAKDSDDEEKNDADDWSDNESQPVSTQSSQVARASEEAEAAKKKPPPPIKPKPVVAAKPTGPPPPVQAADPEPDPELACLSTTWPAACSALAAPGDESLVIPPSLTGQFPKPKHTNKRLPTRCGRAASHMR